MRLLNGDFESEILYGVMDGYFNWGLCMGILKDEVNGDCKRGFKRGFKWGFVRGF